MRYVLALFLPWLPFFTMRKPVSGIACLLLQITIIGWIPATIWSFMSIANYHADKRVDRIVKAVSGPATKGGTQHKSKSKSAPDVGEETWHAIANGDNQEQFREFIARFPQHPRALLAKVRLDQLSKRSATDAGEAPKIEVDSVQVSLPVQDIPTPLTPTVLRNKPNSEFRFVYAALVVGLLAVGGYYATNKYMGMQQAEVARLQQEDAARIESERQAANAENARRVQAAADEQTRLDREATDKKAAEDAEQQRKQQAEFDRVQEDLRKVEEAKQSVPDDVPQESEPQGLTWGQAIRIAKDNMLSHKFVNDPSKLCVILSGDVGGQYACTCSYGDVECNQK